MSIIDLNAYRHAKLAEVAAAYWNALEYAARAGPNDGLGDQFAIIRDTAAQLGKTEDDIDDDVVLACRVADAVPGADLELAARQLDTLAAHAAGAPRRPKRRRERPS